MDQTALASNTPATKVKSDDAANSNHDTINLLHDSSGAGLDFFGDGSMKDITMKMGDLDKVLDEIHQLDEEKPESSDVKQAAANLDKESENKGVSLSAHDSPAAVIHSIAATDDDDHDDDDDDYIAGMSSDALAQMQAELKQVEEAEREMQEQQKQAPPPPPLSVLHQQTLMGKTVSAIATKPTPDSSIGISMKTSKGLTWIVGVSENGLLKDSDLRGEMTMLLKSINGVPIKNARHARTLIVGSQRKVKIVAQEVLKQ